ncbi:MAG: hypothetical protein ACTSVI_13635 [Promethearchaeota archaeon]
MKKLEEALDLILQQQFLSPSFRVYNRTKEKTILVKGVKSVYHAIRDMIVKGFTHLDNGKLDSFIQYLSNTFQVPVEPINEKVNLLDNDVFSSDNTMKFVQAISALREYWLHEVYEQIIDDVKKMVISKTKKRFTPTRDEINLILSEHAGPYFSLMQNLYTLRLWSKISGKKIMIRSHWISLMNKLTSISIDALKKKNS